MQSMDPRKQRLFDDIFYVAKIALAKHQSLFDVTGILDQVFEHTLSDTQAKQNFQYSRPWQTLSALIDYAVDGVGGLDPSAMLIDSDLLLKWMTSWDFSPAEEWRDINSIAETRFALDCNGNVRQENLALLANVDLCVVQQALRSGQLLTCTGTRHPPITHDSAYRWLERQPNYVPTKYDDASPLNIGRVSSADEFGQFLAARRRDLGIIFDTGVTFLFLDATPETIAELEQGIFKLPLNTVFYIADFYQLKRSKLLDCVMRVFFPRQLNMLEHSALLSNDKNTTSALKQS